MDISFQSWDATKRSLLAALGCAVPEENQPLRIHACGANLPQLLIASRIHCISKVRLCRAIGASLACIATRGPRPTQDPRLAHASGILAAGALFSVRGGRAASAIELEE